MHLNLLLFTRNPLRWDGLIWKFPVVPIPGKRAGRPADSTSIQRKYRQTVPFLKHPRAWWRLKCRRGTNPDWSYPSRHRLGWGRRCIHNPCCAAAANRLHEKYPAI